MTKVVLNRGTTPDDPTADSIYTGVGQINDMYTELYDHREHNVMDYGAVGNASYNTGGGADDTVAIQAAYDAANATGGRAVVVFPGRHTYRITDTIDVPQGVYTKGIGGQEGIGVNCPPIIVWDGADNGIMMLVSGAVQNVPSTLFENITLHYGISITNKPLNAIKFVDAGSGGRPDSGTGLKNVWLIGMSGDALLFDVANTTNFFIEGGRFDSNLGYGICALLPNADSSFICSIYGNTNWVGGGRGQGKGFIHMDAGAGYSHISIVGLHTEVNQDMTETFAAGANPYDKQGIIRLGVDSTVANVQHHLNIHGWANSNASALKSYSAIQITAASGTDAAISDCVGITLANGSGLSSGTTDAGTTDQVRLLGGQIESTRRFPYSSVRTSMVVWGQGKNSLGEGLRSFWHQRHGAAAFRGLTIQPEVVANLESSPVLAGAVAYVTDSNSTTLGATVAAGGANKVLVMHNGTNWKIIAVVN